MTIHPQLRRALALAAGRQDLLLAGLLMASVVLMIIPIPTFIVDFLLASTIAVAVLMLMVAVYLRSPLDLSVLPGIILVSTVMRLALSVTTTRLILSDGDAGELVQTFGEFVIAGNVVVGIVVFLIITVVQFLVVTKGAERVAEVGARFTLDALPGKQMSIDADLRSGDIDQAEARRRRSLIERESQLHGAMDGAMKFVKGDAIAGLIIIAVNLVGGIAIGMAQRGLPFDQALRDYTLLTVGDALVSQIPALFTAITAAVVVTRVRGEGEARNLGEEMVRQLAADRRALRLSAVVLVGMALVPGFPAPVFLLLALCFGAASLPRSPPADAPAGGHPGAARQAPRGKDGATAAAAPPTEQPAAASAPAPVVMLRLAPDLALRIDRARLERSVALAREAVAAEIGIALPEVVIGGPGENGPSEGMHYAIEIDGVPTEEAEARPDHLLLRDDPAHLDLLGDVGSEIGPPVQQGAALSYWIPAAEERRLAAAGIGYNDCAGVLGARIRDALRMGAPGFLGIQETKALLGRHEAELPELVREAMRVAPIQRIADVLRRLVEEGVSVRNMRAVLEAIAEWGEREPRAVLLAEYVRAALARQICHRHAGPGRVLSAWVLDSRTESVVREALRETTVGLYLALDAATSDELVESVRQRRVMVPEGQVLPVLICSMDIRRYVRSLLIKNGVDVAVLSYQDLAPDFPVHPLGSVGLAADQMAERLISPRNEPRRPAMGAAGGGRRPAGLARRLCERGAAGGLRPLARAHPAGRRGDRARG